MTATLDLREDHTAILRNVLRTTCRQMHEPTYSGRVPAVERGAIPISIWRSSGTARLEWT